MLNFLMKKNNIKLLIKENPIILFDGVCNLCNASVQFVLKHEKESNLKFASLQSEFAKNILEKNGYDFKNYNTIVFIENGKFIFKSSAAFAIAKYLKFPFNLFNYFHFLPKIITDFCYKNVSRNRYKIFGKSENCYVPTVELESRFVD